MQPNNRNASGNDILCIFLHFVVQIFKLILGYANFTSNFNFL